MNGTLQPDNPEASEFRHRMSMEVSWSDNGWMIIRHRLASGGYVSHVFDIGVDKTDALTMGKKNV